MKSLEDDLAEPVRLIDAGQLAPLLMEYRKRTDPTARGWATEPTIAAATTRVRGRNRARAVACVALAGFAGAWLALVAPRALDRGAASPGLDDGSTARVRGTRGAGGSEGSSGSTRAPGGGAGAGGA